MTTFPVATFTFEVFFATDKDTLMAGELEAGMSRIEVEAGSAIDARLVAEQMVAATGREPTRCVRIFGDD